MIRQTSTEWAPWYVVPADHNWVRNLAVGQILVDTLERLDPQLPPPDECFDPKDFPGSMPASTIFDRVEYRLGDVPGWALGKPSGDPTEELWQRLAGGREIDCPALAFLVDAYAPPVLELGVNGSMTVQLNVHLHRKPVPGWIATRLTTRHVINGYHEEDCELWDEAGNLVAQSRQLAMLV